MKTYLDKLKDPRWQRKRLEVLQAANFRCQECCDADSTIHVHHTFYERGKEPWEYDSKHLLCLCERCHKARHFVEKRFSKFLAGFSELEVLRLEQELTHIFEEYGDITQGLNALTLLGREKPIKDLVEEQIQIILNQELRR